MLIWAAAVLSHRKSLLGMTWRLHPAVCTAAQPIKATEMTHAYGLFQDGMMVASVYCERLYDAQREIAHYAMVYGQDGPVEIQAIDPDDNEPWLTVPTSENASPSHL